jgi:protoheme IX farnesyltransferase
MSFVMAMVMGYAGIAVLALLVNLSAAALALTTILIYVLLYTPLKTRTTLNTLVGAVCGAIPPMIGWVAASGRIDPGAWALAAILFVWQIPHFLALAWLHRDDYSRGGFAMLPAIDRNGQLTGRVIVVSCLMMMMVALGATLFRVAGPFYAAGSLLIGLWWLILCIRLHLNRSNVNARWVFVGSLIYLPVILCLMMCDRNPTPLRSPEIHMLAASESSTD